MCGAAARPPVRIRRMRCALFPVPRAAQGWPRCPVKRSHGPRWTVSRRACSAGARVLDLFAGSGQLGIEALSRGAARCVFIDSSREACAVVRQNLKAAGLFEKASVAETAAEMYLAACRERFDLVLLDPPYRQGTVAALLPAVAAVTAPGGTVLAETEHGASLPERCGTLTLKKQYKYGTVALARYEADAEF